MPDAADAAAAGIERPARSDYGAVAALKGVSLTVAPGEVVALLGANGAGKSTMLRTISGLVRPRAGHIRLSGSRSTGLPPARIVRLGIAHCPEGRRVFGSLTVAENLRLGAATRTRSGRGIAADRERMFALFPDPARAHAPARRHALRRRAADAGARPRADGAARGCCCSTSLRSARAAARAARSSPRSPN